MSNLHAPILVLLVGGSIGLCSWNSNLVALGGDESFSWRVSTRPTIELLRDVACDTHPPAHFLILKTWHVLFGSSPAAIRSLSAVCAALTVPFVYVGVVAALTGGAGARPPPIPHRCAALVAATLTAGHVGQVAAGQTARMYALAALMSAVTAWALLKALHHSPKLRWWLAYGFSVAGLLYTHHYGWFTLAAQVLFVLGVIVQRARASRQDAIETASNLLFAIALVLALYSPWLPVFVAQARRVHEEFWVSAASAHETWWQLLKWLTGLEYLSLIERWAIVGGLGASALWLVVRRDSAAIFFLVQAAIPWAATLTISSWGGRPLLQDRYLVLAQVPLLAFVGVVCARLAYGCGAVARDGNASFDKLQRDARVGRRCSSIGAGDVGLIAAIGWGCLWLSLCGYACLLHMAELPKYPPPMSVAAKWLKAEYRMGDRLISATAIELNVVRYYAAQANMQSIDVRCEASPFSARGQAVHLASLHAEDVVYDLEDVPDYVTRIWALNGVPKPRSGWKRVLDRTFADGRPANGAAVTLALYVRSGSS